MRVTLIALLLVGLTTAAAAADLPPARAPLFTWTGVYAGLFTGYGTLDRSGSPLCVNRAGIPGGQPCAVIGATRAEAGDFVAGSEIGYNLQLSPDSGLVIGAAIDSQFTRLRGYGVTQGRFPIVGGGFYADSVYHIGQRLDSLQTVRGKVGYAFDRVFVYGTGGLAFGDVRIDSNATLNGPNRTFTFDARDGDRRIGYAAGGGVEYAISPRLSVKAEALYYDLGGRTVLAREGDGFPPGVVYGGTIETRGVLARAGLNYRFDTGLPVIGLVNDLLVSEAYAPPPPSIWTFETGTRYFYSTGNFRYTLGAPGNAAQTNSRLIYRDVGAHSGESFARLDHNPTGLFVQGFLGSGLVTSGGQTDEDFPPAFTPYSRTVSKVPDGDVAYAAADVGYDVLRGDGYRLGAYVGYQYVSEFINGFGCAQTTGGQFCGIIPTDVKVFTQNDHWNALRVGLAGELRYDRFRVALEGAYLPVAELTGYDRHWLRPDINPLPQKGSGDGYFLQGLVSYDLTSKISVGAGGRYWRMTTDSGTTRFPFLRPSPTKFETDRIGAFAQISYRFTDDDFDLGGSTGR